MTNRATPPTETPAALRAQAIADRIKARCEAYHVDQLSYDAFHAGQRADWKEATKANLVAEVRALVHGRSNGVALRAATGNWLVDL